MQPNREAGGGRDPPSLRPLHITGRGRVMIECIAIPQVPNICRRWSCISYGAKYARERRNDWNFLGTMWPSHLTNAGLDGRLFLFRSNLHLPCGERERLETGEVSCFTSPRTADNDILSLRLPRHSSLLWYTLLGHLCSVVHGDSRGCVDCLGIAAYRLSSCASE